MKRSMEKIGIVSSTVGGSAPQTGQNSNQFLQNLKFLSSVKVA